ncbi:MAG: ABC transporter ATP-binding protein [Candidatus Azobacteroides sp.]|nr:ABC transporter ATP-binding protein [Candidatus Azobacteroides sp.]
MDMTKEEQDSIIEINNLSKIYQEDAEVVKALDNINLNINKGEFTAVVGPSGSGKTTLLNMIGGLDKPTSGTVAVDGMDVTKLSIDDLINFRRDHVGFVFQAYNLIPVLTAKENVMFVMDLQGIPTQQSSVRAIKLLKNVGLGDRINARPNKLSGGQQQRVAVARALASKPKFILADEPTANLDGKSAETLLDIMEKMNEEENMTFIFSTHDPRVMQKARRIITLEDGKIVR